MRKGNVARRRLEFEVIKRQVVRHKERFIRRLQGLVDARPDGCVLFLGSKRKDGYARMNFVTTRGDHVQVDAQRVFLILALGRPIKIGYDAGHEAFCQHRHCVRHLFEQSMHDNYTQKGRQAECPF